MNIFKIIHDFPSDCGNFLFGKYLLKGAPSPIDHPIINPILIASLVPEIFINWFSLSTTPTTTTGPLYSDEDGVGHLHEYFQNYS
jgi:hypothetical protein